MDTLGLHVFGLPDVQCHFRDREPARSPRCSSPQPSTSFRSGDVIADGNTISGPRTTRRLVCFHEQALLAPADRSSMSILVSRTRPGSAIGALSCERSATAADSKRDARAAQKPCTQSSADRSTRRTESSSTSGR